MLSRAVLPILMAACRVAAFQCETHTFTQCADNIVHWYDPDDGMVSLSGLEYVFNVYGYYQVSSLCKNIRWKCSSSSVFVVLTDVIRSATLLTAVEAVPQLRPTYLAVRTTKAQRRA